MKLGSSSGNQRVVGCNWVFRIKYGICNVEPKRFKARLAAKGFTQKEMIDFIKVFSFVVTHASTRIILSLVATNDIHLEHMDAKTAFQYGELQEEIVMSQLESFEDLKRSNNVCLLKKSLYGLK